VFEVTKLAIVTLQVAILLLLNKYRHEYPDVRRFAFPSHPTQAYLIASCLLTTVERNKTLGRSMVVRHITQNVEMLSGRLSRYSKSAIIILMLTIFGGTNGY